MSHLRFYRAILRTNARLYRATKSQTLRLSSRTLLRLCRVNKHGFCTSFPVSRSSFTNTLPKWWNFSISNLFWTSWLIARFHFVIRQPTKTKLLGLPRMSVISHVSLVCLRDKVACVHLHSRTLRLCRAMKSQVWHRYKPVKPSNLNSWPWPITVTFNPGELWSWTMHTQTINVKGQLVQMLQWKQSHGRTWPIALPFPQLTRSEITELTRMQTTPQSM